LYEVRIDPDHGVVQMRFMRNLKAADALDATRDVAELPGFRAGMNGLVDLREVDEVEILGDDVRSVAQVVASQEELYRGSRWAIVADSNVTYGLARQFQAMRDELGYELGVFRTMDEACAWLGTSSR